MNVHCRLKGFTLLELLVAITVLGVLMSLAFGALRIGSRSLSTGINRADLNEEMRATSDFLRRQFAQLTTMTWNDGVEEKIVFGGNPNSVIFVAPAPEASPGAGLVVVRITTVRVDDAIDIQVGVAPFDPGNDQWNARSSIAETRLARNLADATISYYGLQDKLGEAKWHDEWRNDAIRFPDAVRVATLANDATASRSEYLFRIVSEREL